jgi:hypothetical protein
MNKNARAWEKFCFVVVGGGGNIDRIHVAHKGVTWILSIFPDIDEIDRIHVAPKGARQWRQFAT